MNIRKLFGLCEHSWSIERGLIELSVGLAQGFGEKIVTGFIVVKECDKCHEIKRFRI